VRDRARPKGQTGGTEGVRERDRERREGVRAEGLRGRGGEGPREGAKGREGVKGGKRGRAKGGIGIWLLGK